MTEEEWLAATDPTPILGILRGKASDRKFRLLACAACRRIWDLMHDQRCRTAVEASEQFADGLISEKALDLSSAAAEEAFEDAVTDGQEDPEAAGVAHTASYATSPSLGWDVLLESLGSEAEVAPTSAAIERSIQARIVRDIFGNPFRPAAVDPKWLTSTVVALAEGIYQQRAFDRMPILADALEEAGCDHADILNHCRGDGQHVRGCWVVDLLTGRK